MKKDILLGLATALAMAGQSTVLATPTTIPDAAYWPKPNTAKKQSRKAGKREHKDRHKKGRP
jgi:hypothetical protein